MGENIVCVVLYHTFVAHSMICSKNISCSVVIEVAFHEIVHSLSYFINNLDIVQIDAWIGPMCMTIRIATQQVQKYNQLIL